MLIKELILKTVRITLGDGKFPNVS
jgi:hypothetical protein